MRVRDTFAYIGAGGTNYDYLGGKLDQVTTGAGIANYTWDGPRVKEVEVKRPPTKKVIDGIERLDERVEKIEYTYGGDGTKNKFNVIKSVESKDDGKGNYLVTETTYDYKATHTNSFNRGSGSMAAREIGGILTESNVRTFESTDGATPAADATPLTNRLTMTYTYDYNAVARVDDSGTGQWVEYNYESRNNNILIKADASDDTVSTYHYNEFAVPGANNAFDLLTGVHAYDGAVEYKNEYDFTGFGKGNNDTVSGLLESIKRNDTTYSFAYDIFGQIENVKIGNKELVKNEYHKENDSTGKIRRFSLKESTYANGAVYAPDYDERGRVVAERWNGAATPNVAYAFNDNGTLSRVTTNEIDNEGNKVNVETQFGHDMQGRLMDIYAESKVPATIQSSRVRLGLNTEGQLADFRLSVNGNLLSRMEYKYDSFDRLSATSYLGRELKYSYSPVTTRLTSTDNGVVTTSFSYDDRLTGGNLLAGNVTRMSTSLPNKTFEYNYTYKPSSGKIQTINDHTYTYDKIGQLVKDNTTTYAYDLGGNLTHINGIKKFKYDNSNWKDQLTEFDGKALTYDEIGNLKTYDGSTYTWQKANQLASISGNVNAQYTYDYTGLRSSKTVGGVTTNFIWAGGLLMAQVGSDGNTIAWSYDQGGKMLGFTLNGVPYFYIRNLQGDVVGIYDAAGAVVATYAYDAWGKILDIQEFSEYTIGEINPIRYRGYYHDTETGYYYCQSRYYNPQWCRWISADAYMDTGDGIMGTNMYAYCQGDPVNFADPSGHGKVFGKGGWIGPGMDRSNWAFMSWFLMFEKVSDSLYHSKQDTWQQLFGYTNFYDKVFDAATSIGVAKFPFEVDGKEYIIWCWKGDYLNLGAGAEIGIYYGNGKDTKWWGAGKEYATRNQIVVSYRGEEIISYKSAGLEWWTAVFNPKVQKADANKIAVTGIVDFGNQTDMYKAFLAKWNGKNGVTDLGNNRVRIVW
jgi:RHS repeat-associated protein